MANFKAEIAEALYDSSVNVSREALIWAMTNLPDGENKGSFKPTVVGVDTTFNHDCENLWEALGLEKSRIEELSKVMSKQLSKIKEPDSKVSIVVEGVINAVNEHPDLLKLIVAKTVQDALEMVENVGEMGEMAKMLKIMRMIDKLKGKDNED